MGTHTLENPEKLALSAPISEARGKELISAQGSDFTALLHAASFVRDQSARPKKQVTYSRKVFIPLTTYCRDDCGYCTFKRDPGQAGAGYLTPEAVLKIATEGKKLGCKEALFSLGDKPEIRFPEAARELKALGYGSTAEYLAAMAQLVLEETGLLPHANPGTLSRGEMEALRPWCPSMGVMLENLSPRMKNPGMPHHHAPDKSPGARVNMLRFAGALSFPFTTGLLIGIGETPAERVETLAQIAQIQGEYGHIQEVIVQNFRAKPGIPMAAHPDASLTDLLRTLAVARLMLGPEMNIQAPPNLSPEAYPLLLMAGMNDWGGVSPLTPDHINPEAPWPEIQRLAQASAEMGFSLRERLTIYPEYIHNRLFLPESLKERVHSFSDAEGYAVPHEKHG